MKYLTILALLFCATAQAAVNLPLTCTTEPVAGICANANRVFAVPNESTLVSTPSGWQRFTEGLTTVLVCLSDVESGTPTNDCPKSAKMQVPYCSVHGAQCIDPDPEPAPANNTATVTWTQKPLYTDGTKAANLAGFRIYSGTTKADGSAPNANDLGIIATVPDPTATMHKIPGFGWGRYFFSVSAYTSAGVESKRSGITQESTLEFIEPVRIPSPPTDVKVAP